MNNLMNNVLKNTNKTGTFTENGAPTLKTSLSNLTDFFFLGGALRTRKEKDILDLFIRAYAEDNLLAVKMLFYFRDIRGGQGERRTFRICWKWLGDNAPNFVSLNLINVAEFGRFDDLFELMDTKVEKNMMNYVSHIFKLDLAKLAKDKPISLLAKWMKSENTSSKESRNIAKKLRWNLEMTSKEYRLNLTKLRKALNVVEVSMSSNNWLHIDYSKVSSRASLLYKDAFKKHDEKGYTAFLNRVEKGEDKINAGTLYPYEIVAKYNPVDVSGAYSFYGNRDTDIDPTVEALWKALPNYVGDSYEPAIVVADTSGSMHGDPMNVSISLAIYFAERNLGSFKDYFMTFSRNPAVQKLTGESLREKVTCLEKSEWGMNTDLEKVFEVILQTAQILNTNSEDMIKKIYIISDMEFDKATKNPNKTNFENIKLLYKTAGYNLPDIVFWNVNARQNQSPVEFDERGTMMVSGCSPSIFQYVMKMNNVTPFELMMSVLNSERYSVIKGQE